MPAGKPNEQLDLFWTRAESVSLCNGLQFHFEEIRMPIEQSIRPAPFRSRLRKHILLRDLTCSRQTEVDGSCQHPFTSGAIPRVLSKARVRA